MSVPPEEDKLEETKETNESSNPEMGNALHVPAGNFLQLEPLGEEHNPDPQNKSNNLLDIFKNFKLLLPFDQQEQCREGKENAIEFDDPSLLTKFLSDNDVKSGKISCNNEETGMQCIGELSSKFAGVADVAFKIVNLSNGKQANVDGDTLAKYGLAMATGVPMPTGTQSPEQDTEDSRTKASHTPKPRPPGMIEE